MAFGRRTKAYVVTALFSLLFSLTGCHKAETPTSKNQLYLNLGDDPSTLDPRICHICRDLTVTKQLFDGLMRIDQSGKPIPAIASRYELSADGKIYTFFLRDALWTDGKEVTAYDFEYAWKKVLDPQFPTDYAHMLFVIKNGQSAKLGKVSLDEIGIRVIDEKTLEVTLENPTPYFLELVAFPTYYPIQKGLDERSPNWASPPGSHYLCNGPYRLSKWQSGQSLLIEKNPLYWDKESVFLDGITFTVLSDPTTESYLYEKEELDWLGQPLSKNITPELAVSLRKEGKLSSYPIAGTSWILVNTQSIPFNNAKMRKAFSFAISREKIITHILQGKQQVATSILPPSMTLHSSSYFKDGNVEKAKELFNEALAEMKMTKETLPPILLSFPQQAQKQAQALQEMWQQAFDISINIETTEYKYFKDKVRSGRFQIGTGEWVADFNDPISFLEIFKTRGGMNETGWENPVYIALLDKAKSELDLVKRASYLEEAEALLIDEMVVMPVYHYSFDYVKRERVHDVALSPLGIADFKSARKS